MSTIVTDVIALHLLGWYSTTKMNEPSTLPKLITFDGEARSGKGTIVQATKDYLRDECGHKVMLIDAGQVFRVLAVAAKRSGVDLDNAGAIDAYLSDDANAESCVQLVKDVYHMPKDERDSLLYTNEAGENSAKMGKRPLSQDFKDTLLRKWLRDARVEGFEVVLLDGRALVETGEMLLAHGLCEFSGGYYFVCDPSVGARRTLGFASKAYTDLTSEEQCQVDELVQQINARNEADHKRAVQPVVPPSGAPTYHLPNVPDFRPSDARPMFIIDTSAEISKEAMSLPVAKLSAALLAN